MSAATVPRPDATTGPQDAGSADGSTPDAGSADRWFGRFRYRRQVRLVNSTGAAAAVGVTVRLVVPHAAMVQAGQSTAAGDDLALYSGQQPVDLQFDDRAKVGTDDLALVAALPFSVPPGDSDTPALHLYFGDTGGGVTRSDSVYVFAERFARAPGRGWSTTGGAWSVQCRDRTDASQRTSICVSDGENDPTRRTLATPPVSGIQQLGRSNQVYEVSAHMAGIMAEPADLLYFSYAEDTASVAQSTTLIVAAYQEFPPNAETTFEETDQRLRQVSGWRFGATAPGTEWTRTRFLLSPNRDSPSLHFRYVSPNGTRALRTMVALDDLTVRRALDPELGATLGPVETP